MPGINFIASTIIHEHTPAIKVMTNRPMVVGMIPACWKRAGSMTMAGPQMLLANKLKPPQKPMVLSPPKFLEAKELNEAVFDISLSVSMMRNRGFMLELL